MIIFYCTFNIWVLISDKDLSFHSVNLFDECYCIRTRSDIYHESITQHKPSLVTLYESELVDYTSGKLEQSQYYCKVGIWLDSLGRFVPDSLKNQSYYCAVVVRKPIMRNAVILLNPIMRYSFWFYYNEVDYLVLQFLFKQYLQLLNTTFPVYLSFFILYVKQSFKYIVLIMESILWNSMLDNASYNRSFEIAI